MQNSCRCVRTIDDRCPCIKILPQDHEFDPSKNFYIENSITSRKTWWPRPFDAKIILIFQVLQQFGVSYRSAPPSKEVGHMEGVCRVPRDWPVALVLSLFAPSRATRTPQISPRYLHQCQNKVRYNKNYSNISDNFRFYKICQK